MPALRSTTGLVDLGDAQPVGTRLQRGAADGRRPVAVAVGLDHRAHRAGAGDGAAACARCGATAARSISAQARRHQRAPAAAGRARRRAGQRPPAARRRRRTRPGPGAGPRLGRPAVQPGAGGGRLEAATALGQQRADHAREHVAGAGGRQPGVAGWSTARTRPSGWATTVVGPLSSTTAPVAAARPRAAAMRSAPGRLAGEAGELAVVGRQDGRAPRPCGDERRPPRRAEGGQAVAVDHQPAPGPRPPPGGRRSPVGAPRPRPGPRTSAPTRSSSSSTTASQPAAGTAMPTASVGRRRVVARGRARRRAPCPRPARWAARAARWAAPVMPGEPAATTTAGPPLVGVGRRARHPPGHVGALDQADPGAASTSSPMSATHRPRPPARGRGGTAARA